MITLKTSAEHKWGKINNLPGLGKTQISAEGTIEVSTMKQAEDLVSLVPDFSILEGGSEESSEELKPQTQEEDLSKVQKPDIGTGSEEDDHDYDEDSEEDITYEADRHQGDLDEQATRE